MQGTLLSQLLESPVPTLQNIHTEWRRYQGIVGGIVCSYVRGLEGDVARAVRNFRDLGERTIPTGYRMQDLTPYLKSAANNPELRVLKKEREESALHYHVQDPTLGPLVLKILLIRDPVIQEKGFHEPTRETPFPVTKEREGKGVSFSFDEFVVEGLCALYVPGVLAGGGLPEFFVRYISPMPGALCSDLEQTPVIGGFLMEEVTGGSVASPPDSLLLIQESRFERRVIVNPTAITGILFQVSVALLYLREKIQFQHRRLYAHNVLLSPTPCSFQAYGFQFQSSFTCKIGDCDHASFSLLTTEGPISVSRYKYVERNVLENAVYERTQRTAPFSNGTRYHLFQDLGPEVQQEAGPSLDLYTLVLSMMSSSAYFSSVMNTPLLKLWWNGLFLDKEERLRVQEQLQNHRKITPSTMSSLLARTHLREDALNYTIQHLGSQASSSLES